MPDKATKYAAGDNGKLDTSKLRVAEARKWVRMIQSHEILSVDWMSLVDALDLLAFLAQQDKSMPNNLKVTETIGRDHDGGTLWDQEENENTIRTLVEEAKVSLCLRIMNDYKTWHYDTSQRSASIKRIMQTAQLTEAQLERKCLQFEECLGLLLYQAFNHVETLQLTDIPFLIEHCTLVLTTCEALRLQAPNNAKTQETMVVYYFSSLMKHAESLNNTEILAKTREFQLVHLIVRHLETHYGNYPLELLLEVCEGLAALCDNEDFQPCWKDFFDPGQMQQFLGLDVLVVQQILQEQPEKKKALRPLTDFFNTLKRSM